MNKLAYIDKFKFVLRDDEEVLWTGTVNKKAYTKKILRNMALMQLFPLFLPFLFLALTLFMPVTLYFINRSANNTFLCLTNQQIIKRFGIFKTDINRIPYSSVMGINLKTSIFDSDNPLSSDLYIITKGVHERFYGISVNSLDYADEAYKIISKHSDNEAQKIKM